MVKQTEVKYHKILLKDINPYFDEELESTVYLLGSPGSGKTKFLQRLRDETGGKLVIESGVFDLFQKYITEFLSTEFPFLDIPDIKIFIDDFEIGSKLKLPEIYGVATSYHPSYDIFLSDILVENDIGLPYKGLGATFYREVFSREIKSGGKSCFPDWLFIPKEDGKYIQVISYPGHHSIDRFISNKSIPNIAPPDSVIYLVDPNIHLFYIRSIEHITGNTSMEKLNLHLTDVIELEKRGVSVNWFLSKTKPGQLGDNVMKAIQQYSSKDYGDLSEIVKRLYDLDGFDSIESPREKIIQILDTALKK